MDTAQPLRILFARSCIRRPGIQASTIPTGRRLRITFYPDQGQGKYDWLERECEFKLALHDDRYTASVAVQVGNELYDPQLRWAEPDGSVVLSDIGGPRKARVEPRRRARRDLAAEAG